MSVQEFGEGVVRFVGAHHSKDKKRVGVELDSADGTSKGKFGGHRYFKCEGKGKRGVLVHPKKVTPATATNEKKKKKKSKASAEPSEDGEKKKSKKESKKESKKNKKESKKGAPKDDQKADTGKRKRDPPQAVAPVRAALVSHVPLLLPPARLSVQE